MEVVFLQFTLMTVNLFAAKIQKDNNRNPAFNYFVAGMCFGFGLTKLINMYVK
jgi:hypothetical protein